MEQQPAAGKGKGHIAGMVAGLVALIIVNVLGLGSFLGGRFLTGFIVGGVTYFVVALLVDSITVQRGSP